MPSVKKKSKKSIFFQLLLIFLSNIFVFSVSGNLNEVFAQAVPTSTRPCVIYMIDDLGPNNTRIFTFDPDTQEVQLLGSQLTNWNVEALDIDPATNIIYVGVSDNSIGNAGWLYTVDADDGEVHPVGDTGMGAIDALSFNPVTGELWGARDDVSVFKINKNTAQVTQLYTGLSSAIEGIAWNNTGTTLFMTTGGGTRMYTFDPGYSGLARPYADAPLPAGTEGLDGLGNGYLLGGTQYGSEINLYIYNPNAADQTYPNAIVETLLVNHPIVNDVEGISWPANCGSLSLDTSPSCRISLSIPNEMDPFASYVITINENPPGSVAKIEYSSSDIGHAYFGPNPPTSSTTLDVGTNGFSTILYTSSPGTVEITASAETSTGEICLPEDETEVVQIVDQPAWLQVLGGSVYADRDINVPIPSGRNLIELGSAVEEGVAMVGGTINTGAGNLSDPNYQCIPSPRTETTFTPMYFLQRLSSLTSNNLSSSQLFASTLENNGTDNDGYYIFYYDGSDGDLTLMDDVDLGNRKVILLVENASLTINGNINLNDGLGFFMAVAENDIYIDDQIGSTPGSGTDPNLEGLFYAGNKLYTGTNGGGDSQLIIRGSVSALSNTNGLVLQRDLSANDSFPGELFIAAPDLVLRYPDFFGKTNLDWREIAP